MNKLLSLILLIGAFSFIPLDSARAGCDVRPGCRHVYVHRCYVRPVAYRCWRPCYRHVYVRRYCRPRCYYPRAVVYGPRCGVRYCP